MNLIVVPLDYSDCASTVLAEGVRFARAFGAELLLLHVSDLPAGVGPRTVVNADRGAHLVRDVVASDAHAHLDPLVAAARAQGVAARTAVESGRVSEAILAAVRREGAVMIVMGTHGRTGIARRFFGSVAEEVMSHAEVPVVTVRMKRRPECEASDCGACGASRSPAEEAIAAEDVG